MNLLRWNLIEREYVCVTMADDEFVEPEEGWKGTDRHHHHPSSTACPWVKVKRFWDYPKLAG